MKLLLCGSCYDIFNLDFDLKKCKCGETERRYLDELNATYKGNNTIPVGFSNPSLAKAISNQSQEAMGEEFTAFIIPKECPTFKKVD
jgi:hypothetical protein